MTAIIEEITDVDPAELDDNFARWLNQACSRTHAQVSHALVHIPRKGGSAHRNGLSCYDVYAPMMECSLRS